MGTEIFHSSGNKRVDLENNILIPSDGESNIVSNKKQKAGKSNKVTFEKIKNLTLQDVVYSKDEGIVTHIGIHKIDLCTNDCRCLQMCTDVCTDV